MSGPQSKPVFTSIRFDSYGSNTSEPFFFKDPRITSDTAEINGGLRYLAKTDGKRLGAIATASPRPGWREFKPIENGRSYLSTASAK
jgi:hypothetical protein